MALGELGSSYANLTGQQQLTARRRPYVGDLLERALVGDREAADLVDLVAEELDAQRVVLGRREDVDDAAAYGELTAAFDQVDARVGSCSEVADGLVETDLVALVELDRLEIGETLGLRLEQRTYGRDDDPDRTGRRSPSLG